MRTSSSPPAKGLKRLTSPTPTVEAGMAAGNLMTSGFRTSPSRNCTGPKARGTTSRLRTT
ncbi:MAG: hypothetical protein M3N33_06210 [Actinomycetota bacterium]|nr:hypothetical protein [Actinomycetota bacterium]